MYKMARKNLSGISENDILLVWQYKTSDSKQVYAIHNVINYRKKQKPLGTLTLGPKDNDIDIQWSVTPSAE